MEEALDECDCSKCKARERRKAVRGAARHNDVADILYGLEQFRTSYFTIGEVKFILELSQKQHEEHPLPDDLRRAQNILKRARAQRASLLALGKKIDANMDENFHQMDRALANIRRLGDEIQEVKGATPPALQNPPK